MGGPLFNFWEKIILRTFFIFFSKKNIFFISFYKKINFYGWWGQAGGKWTPPMDSWPFFRWGHLPVFFHGGPPSIFNIFLIFLIFFFFLNMWWWDVGADPADFQGWRSPREGLDRTSGVRAAQRVRLGPLADSRGRDLHVRGPVHALGVGGKQRTIVRSIVRR